MKKGVLKIISIFFILMIIITNFSYVYAAGTPGETIKSYFWQGTNKNVDAGQSTFNPSDLRNQILGVLTVIGYGLAICVILITGIQFLTANAQKKAQLKEKLWLIAIGVLILAAGIPIYWTIREALMKLR